MKTEPDIPIDVKGSRGTFPAVWNGNTVPCRGCHEEIGFARTQKGKWIPIDPPEDDGSAVEPHWASCPESEMFRGKA